MLTPLQPSNVGITSDLQYSLNQGTTDIVYGRVAGGRIHANAVLEGNSLKVIPTTNTAQNIARIENVILRTLTTEQKSYTKFKFIQ